MRYYNLRHAVATKMLEKEVPMATAAQILGWSASTAIRMAKRDGYIRPEAQQQALESIATDLPSGKAPDFGGALHEIGNQLPKANWLSPFRPVAQSG